MGSDSKAKLRKRRVMRRKNARALVEEAAALLVGVHPSMVEQAELEDGTSVYLIDGVAMLARVGGVLFPTLKSPSLERLPAVVVDMGAVPYVCNGADVMAPGIVEVRGDFQKGSLVIVKDVEHGKSLAIGKAKISSKEMTTSKKGKVIKNLHYVGDKLWRAYN